MSLRCPAHCVTRAAVWQVLHYCMYLCVGIWDLFRAETPVDPGFSPRAELQRVTDAAREFYNKLSILNALKYSFCIFVVITGCTVVSVILLTQICSLAAFLCFGVCFLVPCIGIMLVVGPEEEVKRLLWGQKRT